MANGDGIGKFMYWSDRAIGIVAEENGIELQGQRRWTVGLNWKVLQASFAGRERTARNRLAEARRLVKEIGNAAIEDFDTPPPAVFVKGVGTVSFAKFREFRYANNDAALLHIQTRSARGRRVDLCLFGSMDGVRGFGPHDDFERGWTSSAASAIEELLASRGQENTSQWDDEESRADPQRWNLDGELAGAERIIVGRPLWVRSMSPAAIVRYAELRNGPGWARWWWLHRMRRRLQRRPRTTTNTPVAEPILLDTGEIPPRPPASHRAS
ncbi:hypothetical protein ACWEQ3_48920 [Streptomyces mirabilis]